MKTLTGLKQRCTPGTVIEVTRLKYKPATYIAVVAEQRTRLLGLTTLNRVGIGYTDWGKAHEWQLTEDTATKLTKLNSDDTPIALLRLRFLSADELETLPDNVEALSQRYQPETETTEGVTAVVTGNTPAIVL